MLGAFLGITAQNADPMVGAPQPAGHRSPPQTLIASRESPKDFLFRKEPNTDVERVACLAYYLTHRRGTNHFKTIDISKLNTEAAPAQVRQRRDIGRQRNRREDSSHRRAEA